MKYLLLTFCLIGVCQFSNGQTFDIPTEQTDKDYYAWLTALTQGPINWLDEPQGDVRANAFRVCITGSDIYNTIYIEQVTFGREGCCKNISNKKKLDLDELFNRFEIRGERSGVKFSNWLTSTSCEINIYKETFVLTNLDKDNVTVERKN